MFSPADSPATLGMLIPIVAIIGGFIIAGLGIYSQVRRREFEHRERLAMIEKGLTPPLSTGPETHQFERLNAILEMRASVEGRSRRGGFVVIGVGLAAAFFLWMTAHDPDAALGIGGFLVILGLVIYVSSFLGGGSRHAGTPDSQGKK